MRSLCVATVRAVCLFFALFLTIQFAISQPKLGFTSVATGLVNPVDLVPEPGTNRLFVVEQGGTIRIIDGSTVLSTPFLNVSSIISNVGEQGLLSLAFHPDYANNRYFFIYYTNNSNQIAVGRFRRNATNADVADFNSGVVLLNISKNAENHNGGKLNFGPDGKLYFATGDGGGSNDPDQNAQDGTSLLGKMIRLDVDNFSNSPYYTIPSDNPFVNDASVRDEIWAIGLRNPWRWSFDRTNGDVWIADVGQGAWEELSYTTLAGSKGVDYGWHCKEGNHNTPGVLICTPDDNYIPPVFEYGRDMATGGRSITGGYVYQGSRWPSLKNYFICADYVSGNLWMVRSNGTFTLQTKVTGVTNISSFGQDNAGELYALSRNTGTVFNVTVVNEAPLPLTLIHFSGKDYSGYNEITWKTGYEEDIEKYIIEYSTNGTDYQVAGEELSKYGSSGGTYTFTHQINNRQVLRYRLRIREIDNKVSYSPIISIGSISKQRIQVYPTTIKGGGGMVNIISTEPIARMTLYTMEGKEVYSKFMNGVTGYSSIPISGLRKGMYLMRLSNAQFTQTDKIIIE
ncbi:MAG: PQQ-dependent sugar dehydrogenase [Chitinophagaceae bacterium]